MDTKAIAQQFREDGYAIVRGVFSKEEVAEIERQIAECIRTVVPKMKPGDVYYEDTPDKPIKSIFRLEDHSAFFKKLMADERLLGLMREIYAGLGLLPHRPSGVMGFSQTLIHPVDTTKCPEVQLCMKPGDICLHHTNTTDKNRRQSGIIYRSSRAKRDEAGWARYQAELKKPHEQEDAAAAKG